MKRAVILGALLVTGCEQLKSPQRIHDLEDRMDKLTDEVTALKAGSGSAGKPEAQVGSGSGSGSADGSGSDLAAAGSGSAEPAAGSGSETGSGSGSEAVAAAPAAGSGTEAQAGSGQAPPAAGASSGSAAGDKVDRALAELRAVVAGATRPGKLRAPDAAAPPAAPLQTWAYDGKHGTPTWGTLDPAWRACLMGKAQSPVDIEPRAGTASPITFHYKPTAATMFDEGHLLQVRVAPGSEIEIDGRTYQLLQLHFHMPSEHTIAGDHYPLEIQMLHQDVDGKLVMVAVLYDAGAESKLLGELWSRWPRKVGDEDKLPKPFDPGALLPETRTVFRYTGSLTWPPCTEGVTWNVMRRAMSDSRAHLDEFARHYAHSARELQPLGDRKIE